MVSEFVLFFPTLSFAHILKVHLFFREQWTTHFFEALSLFLWGQKRVASCSLCQLYFTMWFKLLDHQSTFYLLYWDAATDQVMARTTQKTHQDHGKDKHSANSTPLCYDFITD